jgi:YesN/AraC family two-component response regulator
MSITGKVMIVDDEPHVRKFVSLIMKRLGATNIVEASDGEQAVEMFRVEQPDLTLLDVNMPRMDGVETLRHIMAVKPEAVVVMLTSLTNRQTVEECSRLGATDYLRKDLPRAEMEAALQRIIDDTAPEAEEEASA